MGIFLILLVLTNQLSPPTKVRAFDTPNDAGKSITITWSKSTDPEINGYQIFRCEPGQEMVCVGTLMPFENQYVDENVKNGIEYSYQVVAYKIIGSDTIKISSELSNPAKSSPQWFNLKRINVLVGMAIFFTLILYFISHARRGKKLSIRRIAGLDAVEEAVGRATEMGKGVPYVPGLSSVSDI
ncbi:MAG: fibronectin type III domain-containing protein, partial [candidate division WOR-3 bacterium]|nr:fibronectin type III domain-containing protein [candidate division WOR-3 bacterium]